MAVRIEVMGPDEWLRVRALRLSALADAPDAFGTTLAEQRHEPESWWRGRLANGSVTLLAVADGEDAGLTVVASVMGEPLDAGMYSVWVAPSARGRGVGDALVRAAIAAATRLGANRLVLDVGDHNAPAIALYQRHGFEPTGVVSTLPPPRSAVTEHERALALRAAD